MPKATQKQLEELHGKLVSALSSALSGDDSIPAALLNTTRQFLSDNGIRTEVAPEDPSEYLHDDQEFEPPADLPD